MLADVVAYLIVFTAISSTVASDPDTLQDVCVAVPSSDKPASVISAFNSQLPGTQSIAATLFTATPPVPDDVLTKAFQVGTKEIEKIKSKLAPKKN
ncbi:hypothetical protein FH972_004928 [Carpinus fangiana]|uniref:Cupin type-1 domain-containing protein n=1 Tax=Carpinus fangiana TaxID=176857 RepID=A0A5N6QR63_9ROSI|nr:hypothetical protein FH972_004928 [Carpinus fangiana]